MHKYNLNLEWIVWDGDVNTWQPPADATMLVQSTTPTKIWDINADKTEFVLTESVGNANIGFTWDGTFAITNEPKPVVPTV